jgi:hypothetical protein
VGVDRPRRDADVGFIDAQAAELDAPCSGRRIAQGAAQDRRNRATALRRMR